MHGSFVCIQPVINCVCVLFICLDYIALPCSQEDDVHNVQSVIDSLSLDYLQISLSHITGQEENLICNTESIILGP